MRHIGTLIAAVVIAPLAWFLLAIGGARPAQLFTAPGGPGMFAPAGLVRPVQVLAGAGLLLGILGTLRFSPLGAVVTGFGYAASYLGLLFFPRTMLHLFGHPFGIAGHHIDPAVPVRNGTVFILGVLLLVGAVSIGRWRRWPRPADDFPVDADRPVGVEGLGLGSRRDSYPDDLEPEPAREPATVFARADTPWGTSRGERIWW